MSHKIDCKYLLLWWRYQTHKLPIIIFAPLTHMSQYWQLEYPSQGKLTSASLTKHEARRRLMSWKKTTIARKNSEKQDWIMKQFSWTFKICISWLFCFNNHQLHSIVNIHTISIYQKHFIMTKNTPITVGLQKKCSDLK